MGVDKCWFGTGLDFVDSVSRPEKNYAQRHTSGEGMCSLSIVLLFISLHIGLSLSEEVCLEMGVISALHLLPQC